MERAGKRFAKGRNYDRLGGKGHHRDRNEKV
jgi:hypothetical protein